MQILSRLLTKQSYYEGEIKFSNINNFCCFFVCCVCTCKCLFFVCFLNILHNDNNKNDLYTESKNRKKAVVVLIIIIICSSIFYNYGRSSFSSFFLCIYSWPAGWWSKCFFFFVVIIVGKIGKNWFPKYTDTDYTYTVFSIHIM